MTQILSCTLAPASASRRSLSPYRPSHDDHTARSRCSRSASGMVASASARFMRSRSRRMSCGQ